MEPIHPLKVYRESQDPPLTQEDLGALLGVDKATVSRWEAWKRKPDLELLPKITKKTGLAAGMLRPDLAKLVSAS